MPFWKTENKLEPKENFYNKIEKYYSELAGNKIPGELLKELIGKITDAQYKDYQRFWDQYPKSRKRYSQFKLSDLEHPFTEHDITDFFQSKAPSNHQKFSKMLLKLNDDELSNHELRKHQYRNK